MNTQNRINFALGLQDRQKRQQSLSAEVYRKRSQQATSNVRSDESIGESMKRLREEARKINMSSQNELDLVQNESRSNRYKRIHICSSDDSASRSMSPQRRNKQQSVKSFSELAFDQQKQSGKQKEDLRSPSFKKSPSNLT